jgi:putative restriction endonuclease
VRVRDVEKDLLTRAAGLNVWSQGKRRAPHKPLLLFLAVRRAQQGLPRTAPWSWWRDHLTLLLRDYAPNASDTVAPDNPFRFLISDCLWEVTGYNTDDSEQFIKAQQGRTHHTRAFKVSWLNRHDPAAGLPADHHHVLTSDPSAADRLVRLLLQIHFPPTLWPDVLADTGVAHDLHALVALPDTVASVAARRVAVRVRDPQFAAKVFEADDGRCVVCLFDGHDSNNDRPVGLDAAHIEWHNIGGPDTLTNGATLCPTHHRLFDRGMFCWEPKTRLLVPSPHYEHQAFVAGLPAGQPAPERLDELHLTWQHANVFRQ